MASITPNEATLAALSFHQQGNLAEAHRRYQALLRDEPENAFAHLFLGTLLHQSGRQDLAESHLLTATRLAPDLPDGWVNLGYLLLALQRSDEALNAFEKALSLDSNLAQAWLGTGAVAQERGDLNAAITAYEKARSMDRNDPVIAFNIATARLAQGKFQQALGAADTALAIDPNLAAAMGIRADALLNLGDAASALIAVQGARRLTPDDATLAYTEGFALTELGQLAAARRAYDEALKHDPKHGGAIAAALFNRRSLCDWEAQPRLLQRFRDGITRGATGLTPFSFLAEPSTRDEQLSCAKLWSEQWPSIVHEPTQKESQDHFAEKRITLAYLSADFYRHPTAHLTAGLFEAHDRDRFRVLAYSNSRDDNSEIRKRLEAGFDEFFDIRERTPESVADHMRDQGVDILIDLKGHTLEAATAVMAQKAAPIQVQYLGYPGTMGCDFIDYLIGDHQVTPATHQASYTEQLVQLAGSYQVNDSKRPCPPASGTRADLGLPADAVVFCCFNNFWKFSRACFSPWMEILRDTPDAVLWLLGRQGSPEVAANLRREAEAAGIAGERLVFSKARPLSDYLALYHHADLFLDSWPYNAHTTASDALWMGCPVLTRAGETFASRVGASLLTASGLPKLITNDTATYVREAVSLGNDPERLNALRSALEGGRDSNPLFQTEATTRQIEWAYEEMMRRQDSGASAGFSVPDTF